MILIFIYMFHNFHTIFLQYFVQIMYYTILTYNRFADLNFMEWTNENE